MAGVKIFFRWLAILFGILLLFLVVAPVHFIWGFVVWPIGTGVFFFCLLLLVAFKVKTCVRSRTLRRWLLAIPIAYVAFGLVWTSLQTIEVMQRIDSHGERLVGEAVEQRPDSVSLIQSTQFPGNRCWTLCAELLFERHVQSVYVYSYSPTTQSRPPKGDRYEPIIRYSIADPQSCFAKVRATRRRTPQYIYWPDHILEQCLEKTEVVILPNGIRVYDAATSPDWPEFHFAKRALGYHGKITNVGAGGEDLVAQWERVEARVWFFPPLIGVYFIRDGGGIAPVRFPITYGEDIDLATFVGQTLDMPLNGYIDGSILIGEAPGVAGG